MVASAAPQTVAGLLRRPRYEVLPLDGVEESVLEHVPREVTLTAIFLVTIVYLIP